MPTTWSESLILFGSQAMAGVLAYVPRIAAALLILIIGGTIAKAVRSLTVRVMKSIKVSSAIEKTPIEHFLKNADFAQKIEEIIGTIIYWLVMLVVIHTAVSVMGLASLSLLLERVLIFLPKIVAAVIILFFGILLAGVVEGLVKGAIRSIDGRSAMILGKVSSYLVVTIAILAAISELGIARDFILILFVGFVSTVTIGLGLAIGLGAKDLVATLLAHWHDNLKREAAHESLDEESIPASKIEKD
jgi:hypothetical protein